jgi:hypothetical protein
MEKTYQGNTTNWIIENNLKQALSQNNSRAGGRRHGKRL